MSDEHHPPQSSRIERALIQRITENGFHIVRSWYLNDSPPSVPNEYCFIVRSPHGEERDVVVELSESAVALIQRKRRIPFSSDNSFWISCAERLLGTYLWEKERFPPGGRLIVEEIELAELEIAKRWECDPPVNTEKIEPRIKSRTKILGKSFYVQGLVAILCLYLIATFVPKALAPDTAHLRDSLSSFILYAAIFLSGTLVGLAIIDLSQSGNSIKIRVASTAKVKDKAIPPSFDEFGLTPVERVIHDK